MGVKKTRLLIALVVALVVASVVSVVIYNFFGPKPNVQVAPRKEPTVEIIVANSNIRVGSRLKPEHIKTASWPQSSLPQDYYVKPEEVLGRAVLSNIVPNEPLMKSKLASAQSGGGLPAVIPEGRRALTLRVDDVVGVAGFVVPDTRVDVLMTRDIEGRLITKTILQNMLVLAAGQQLQTDTDRNPIPAPVVTLSVTPEEAEKLTLASTEGRLQLALRNPTDLEMAKTSGATLATVFAGELPRTVPLARPAPGSELVKVTRRPPPRPILAPPRPVYQVEVIKDNLSTMEKFYLE